LNLTVNYSTTSTTDVTACNTYNWNGVDYTNSGVYTFNTTNAAGCDSTATLNLTINNSTSSTEDVTACDTYDWNGNTYTQSGVYTFSTTNAAGCDSTATLNLTINVSAGQLNANIIEVPTCFDSTGTISITSPLGAGFEYNIDGGAYQTSPVFDQVTAGDHLISVRNPNACIAVSELTITMDAQPRLATIDSILGPINVCTFIGNGTVTYTVSPITPGTQYFWSIPTVGVRRISFSGTGSSSVTLEFTAGIVNAPNKQIKVRGFNECGITRDYVLNLNAQLPDRVSSITPSSEDICAVIGTNNTIRYSIRAVRGATSYNWNSLISSAIITHPNGLGVNDTIVDIRFTNDFIATVLTVSAQNDCGRTSSSFLTLSKFAIPFSGINGPVDVCNNTAPTGTVATYSVNFIGASSYVWSIPDGCTNFTGQGTNTISFLYPQFFPGGQVTVYAINSCGESIPLVLNINDCQNVITGNTPGTSSQIKSPFAVENLNKMKVQIFPNPSTTEFNVKMVSDDPSKVQVKIMDAQGRTYKVISAIPNTIIKLGNELKAGSYWVEFNQNGKIVSERILKF
jgi:hypothetical protein